MENTSIVWLGMLCVAGAAALVDCRTRRIPNLLTYPLILAGLVLHGSTAGLAGVLFSLKGLGIGALFIVIYLGGWLGAGDVKLLMALGSLGGPQRCLLAAVLGALAGGVMALGVMLVTPVYRVSIGGFFTTLLRTGRLVYAAPPPESRKKLPYGLAIAVGTLAACGWEAAGWPFLW